MQIHVPNWDEEEKAMKMYEVRRKTEHDVALSPVRSMRDNDSRVVVTTSRHQIRKPPLIWPETDQHILLLREEVDIEEGEIYSLF